MDAKFNRWNLGLYAKFELEKRFPFMLADFADSKGLPTVRKLRQHLKVGLESLNSWLNGTGFPDERYIEHLAARGVSDAPTLSALRREVLAERKLQSHHRRVAKIRATFGNSEKREPIGPTAAEVDACDSACAHADAVVLQVRELVAPCLQTMAKAPHVTQRHDRLLIQLRSILNCIERGKRIQKYGDETEQSA